MKLFTISEYALLQTEEAIVYYENKEKGLGARFKNELIKVLDFIKENPLLFPAKFKHYREAVVKKFPFLIIYEITPKEVIILNVFHTSQHPKKKIKYYLK